MRPTRRMLNAVCVLILLIGSAAVVAAQSADQKAYQRISVLQVARQLSLNAEQTSEIASLAKEHKRLDTQLQKDLDALHKKSGSALQQALDSWMANRPAGTELRAEANDAANKYRQLLSTHSSESSALVQRARNLLSDQQEALIQSPERTRQRDRDLRFWQNTQQTAKYVVQQIEIARSLNDSEYAAVRILLAQETADFIGRTLGNTREESDQFVEELLSLFDRGRSWSRAEFADRRSQLPGDIIDYLGLGDISSPRSTGSITEAQFALLVTCDQAAPMLSKLKAGTDVQMPEQMQILGACDLQPRPAEEHEMRRLMRKAHYITVLNDLTVDRSQLSEMAPAAENLLSDYESIRQNFFDVVSQHRSALNSLQSTLIEGDQIKQAPVEATSTIFEAELTYQQERTSAAIQQLWSVHDILDQPQNRLINWRPPGPVGPSIPKEQRIQRLTRMAGTVKDFLDMFEEIRYADPTTYQYRADTIAAEFLREYIPERSRVFERRRDYLVDKQVEARQVSEDQWNRVTASRLALETMRGLDLLPEGGGIGMGTSGGPNAPYTWWAMEEIFSDQQTPELLRNMLSKRAG